MKGILATLMIKLGLDSKEFKSGMGDAEKRTNKFGDIMKKVGGMLAAAFAVDRIIAFGKELIQLSGVAEGVRAAFKRIADDQVLRDLQRSTAGTVSELELMKRAVSANNLGVPIQNLASLFEFATKRAQDTGESVDYLVNSIVTGIGRKSPLILDNLGISAVQLREKLEGVGLQTATTAQIAAAVGEIAADSMAKSGGVIDTNATKLQRLNAQWQDFKLSLAEDPKISAVLQKFLDEAQDAFYMITRFQSTEEVQQQERAFDKLREKSTALLQSILANEKALRVWASTAGVSENEVRNEINKTIDDRLKGIASVEEFTDKTEEFTLSWDDYAKTVGELREETEQLKASVDLYKVTQTEEIQATLRQIEANEKLIKTLTELRKERTTQTLTPMQGISGVPSVLGEQPTQGLEIGRLNDYVEQQTDRAQGIYDRYFAAWDNFKQDMAMSAVDFSVNVVDEIGAAFGELARTGEFPDDFGQNILSIIGSFISQLGQMLIALGVASEAFQALLNSAFTNPVSAGLAIAAGVGLVLLGGAIKGFAKAGPSGGSVSSAPSYSSAGSGQRFTQTENNKVVFEIDGNKLVGVLNNTSRRNNILR